MARRNISRTIQSYLQALAEQVRHYAVLRLFNGVESSVNGKLCLDAQVPVLEPESEQAYACSLVALVSYRKGDLYRQELLDFKISYDPGAVVALGPARWGQFADNVAYQLVAQLVLWTQDKQAIAFSPLAATTGLRADRQRFYL